MHTHQSKHVDADGKISVFRLRVPLALALGHLEKLTKEELEDNINDLRAELARRG